MSKAKRASLVASGRLATLIMGVCAAGDPAIAQAEQVEARLDEIVVTARKREEDLQETPVSVTAFSAAAIEARHAVNVAEVATYAPNVSFDTASAISGSSNSATVFIRGIGQTDFNLTIDPGVGLYLDGVYISRAVGALLETADVAQVQILRGPQGTLFGKNTIGGAVVITSQAPGRDPDFTVQATTGRYGRFDLRSMVNVPVTEEFRIRASGNLQTRSGYGSRLSDGQRTGDKDSLSGRLVAEMGLTQSLRGTLAIDVTRAREQAPPIKLLAVDEFGFFPFLHNNFIAGGLGCDQFPGGIPTPTPTPTPTSNPDCYNSQWLTDSPYTNYNSGPNESDLDVWGASLTMDWSGSWGKLKSITAYRDLESSFALESDGSPILIINSQNEYSQSQFSQEFQFTGSALDDRLKWLVGLYYLNEKGEDVNSLAPGAPFISFISGGKVENDSYAISSQISYSLADALTLTLGGRYTDEEKRFLPDQYIAFINPAIAGFMAGLAPIFTDVNGNGGPLEAGDRLLPYAWSSTVAREFTPAVTLDFRANDDLLLYASYSKGFKSGGFTQRVFPPLTGIPSFRPEYVESYETGFKSEWLGSRLRLNGAAYYADYSDQQVLVTVFVAPTVQNAGKARSQGFELELEAVPAAWLQLNGGVGYTDASYKSISAAAAPVTADSLLPNSPKWTANAGATTRVLRTDFGSLSLRADWTYKGSHFKDAVNTPELRQKGVGLLNASATFELGNGHGAFSIGASNLTNEKPLVTGYADLGGAGNIYGIFARPREWFMQVRYTR
jgi:iron complex outermembrane receptor protein